MNLDRIRAFLRAQAQAQLDALHGGADVVSPLPENDTLNTPGKLAYVAMNQQRDEAASHAVPVNNGEDTAAPQDVYQQYVAQKQSLPQQVGQAASSTWGQFVNAAKRVAGQAGFPVQVLLGQAAVETGHGAHAPGNNYFGIKGSGSAGTQQQATQEATPGGQFYGTNANFGAYQSPEDSVRAYINWVKTHAPTALQYKNDPQRMIQEIKKAGYATDPQYAQKVMGTPEFRGQYGH